MIDFLDPPDAPAPGACSRATRAAEVAFACIALGPDAARAR